MDIVSISIQVIVVIMSITIHEYSHALSAYWLGDDTAKRAGRLKLNPISHLDPIGAIMLLVVHIGWAKPVPINPYNFKDMKTGTAISAAAGPISNFIMATLSALLVRFVYGFGFLNQLDNGIAFIFLSLLIKFLYFSVFINLALGLFNLIPLPPLDGSKILGGFLSDEMYFKYTAKEKQGAYILMIIMAVSFIFKIPIFGMIINQPLQYLTQLLLGNII
ncbi:MAG TPA: site-2 protease family protein [Candidatus Cloacimonadota bacterium]|nr:site-2 protease family protein [Candidatus Cloacimonadota bacterium]HOD53789.1 site-2 protease family protein [Candidatus Cloacimonadota bacterium]HPM01448.1 site-2 protease family protein [Candidatus Cloacimonadota bacterium]